MRLYRVVNRLENLPVRALQTVNRREERVTKHLGELNVSQGDGLENDSEQNEYIDKNVLKHVVKGCYVYNR